MTITRKPKWLNKSIEFDKNRMTSSLLAKIGLNTVCREAKCPNMSECFAHHHATFLILGKSCTRHCAFCHVEKSTPQPADNDEPQRIAQAVKQMGLKHAVITSVTRDDLLDGGVAIFIKTVAEIKKISADITLELLIPDFKGETGLICRVVGTKPRIIGHNIETVPRLYRLRPEADYKRSIKILKLIKEFDNTIYTKSALMLGLGEKEKEVFGVMEDLRKADCDFLALGQYLQPSTTCAEVKEYILPEKFEDYKTKAYALGFTHVESGPFVRSSYHVGKYLKS